MTKTRALKPVDTKLLRISSVVALILLVATLSQTAQSITNADAPGATPLTAGADEGDHALLWKVERSGLRPSYVFGTINSEDPRVAELSPAVIKAFQLSSVFAMEMIPDHAALTRMSASMFITKGPNLKDLLGESYYNKVAEVMSKYGLASEVLIKLKPWVVFTALTMPKPEEGMFLDVILYGAAISDGKYVHGLETADEQVAIFEGIRLDDQVAILKDVVSHYSALSGISRELVNRYTQGDLDAVAALQDKFISTKDQRLIRSFRQHTVGDRNLRMVERIVPRIEEQDAFIAIDAGLLPGAQGVLHLLEQRGYRISPVR
jgi:uncharacterized protein YbaP (TraB family)